MTRPNTETVRRFNGNHIVHHWVMLVCFLGLVVTGVPQKFPAQTWAKGLILLFGGVVRVRVVHHLLGTVMAVQLVWHVIESAWQHLVRRLPMPMVPYLGDVKHFLQQIRFNLGVAEAPPEMDRYTFAEKLEYLALVWGTAVMVLTGLLLLYPVRWSSLVPGEVILAAKAAHGGEAILAFLSILTWHVYFVHVRHWNTAIFNGNLDEEIYAEEHSLELARIRRGELKRPARPVAWRVVGFAVMTFVIVGAVLALMWWLRWSPAAVAAVTIGGHG
ncbi:MAG: cytochrome C [Thermoanaerobaculales bacterium]